jgi:hypothetical protein
MKQVPGAGPDRVYDRSGVWGASGDANRYDVEVTPEHIAAGRVGDCARCPVALAVREATLVGGTRREEARPLRHADVAVGALISWTHNGRQIAVRTPARVAAWIARFDRGEPVGPMTFSFKCAGVLETGWAGPSPERSA